jgi:RNA polymerase sigma-70 factor (ECF subfamily)
LSIERVVEGRERHGADAELMARICARDVRAFEELYRKYFGRLSRFLLNLIHRPSLVEEVLNDTMMVVWEKPDSFAGASRLSTWIFGIAYRKAMKALRRWDQPLEDPDAQFRPSDEPGPDQQAGLQQIQARLAAAVKLLSADHRAVVDLTYFQGFAYAEIAEIVGCPVDTVKTRMFHARRHLKRMLAGELSDWL